MSRPELVAPPEIVRHLSAPGVALLNLISVLW